MLTSVFIDLLWSNNLNRFLFLIQSFALRIDDLIHSRCAIVSVLCLTALTLTCLIEYCKLTIAPSLTTKELPDTNRLLPNLSDILSI